MITRLKFLFLFALSACLNRTAARLRASIVRQARAETVRRIKRDLDRLHTPRSMGHTAPIRPLYVPSAPTTRH